MAMCPARGQRGFMLGREDDSADDGDSVQGVGQRHTAVCSKGDTFRITSKPMNAAG